MTWTSNNHLGGGRRDFRRPRYLSYMLRLWQSEDGERCVWRVSLECPGSGERCGFTDLDALVDYLTCAMSADDPAECMRRE